MRSSSERSGAERPVTGPDRTAPLGAIRPQLAQERRARWAGAMVAAPLPTKTCAVCGRTMTWRKAWAKNWDEVRVCSQRCRRHGLNDTDRALEDAIRTLLAARAGGATICPSEAARAVDGEQWRPLMEQARAAARRLVDAGEIVITQQGRVVDPSTARGPIRLRAVALTYPEASPARVRRSGQPGQGSTRRARRDPSDRPAG